MTARSEFPHAWVPPAGQVDDWLYPEGHRDCWKSGELAFFEYHCLMDSSSADFELWRRTQQWVTVVGLGECDDFSVEFPSGAERGAQGVPLYYSVRFGDGHEALAAEDELLVGPQFCSRLYAFLAENHGVQG